MSRYIDADNILYKDLSEGRGVCWVTFRDWIKEMPTADVRENVRGEWEEIEVIAEAYDISGVKTWASKMKCDQCDFTTIAIEGHFSQYNFCPNCGAEMGGES